MAFLVAYALADPGYELATATSAVSRHAGSNAILNGRLVDGGGEPVEGARLVVERAGRRVDADVSDARGAFRVDLAGPCSSYDVALTANADGRRLTTRLRRELCPGEALTMKARVVGRGQLIWMPR
jgi:hypothetical protein